MITVYISIGNSDDKLSQADWSSFVLDVDRSVDQTARVVGVQVQGRWHSLPHEPWQNACWCLTFAPELGHLADALKRSLGTFARAYRQDSIAWATAYTEFIGGVVSDVD